MRKDIPEHIDTQPEEISLAVVLTEIKYLRRDISTLSSAIGPICKEHEACRGQVARHETQLMTEHGESRIGMCEGSIESIKKSQTSIIEKQDGLMWKIVAGLSGALMFSGGCLWWLYQKMLELMSSQSSLVMQKMDSIKLPHP